MNINELKQEIEKSLVGAGLNKLMYSPEVESCLNLTQEELRGMSALDCGVKSYTLKQYSLYLTVECNKLLNIMSWAKRNIDIMVAKEYSNIGDKFVKYEVKRNMFISMNSAAKELYKEYVRAKIKYKSMKEVAKNINYIAETLIGLQLTKRYDK